MKKSLKILVVEDDSDTLDILAKMLIAKGFDVITAVNGAAALELFESEKPDMILSDVVMPNMDGIQLSSAVKNSNYNVPIILFSGLYPDLMEAKIDRRLNCDHVLYKPFAQADVFESIGLFFPDSCPI